MSSIIPSLVDRRGDGGGGGKMALTLSLGLLRRLIGLGVSSAGMSEGATTGMDGPELDVDECGGWSTSTVRKVDA